MEFETSYLQSNNRNFEHKVAWLPGPLWDTVAKKILLSRSYYYRDKKRMYQELIKMNATVLL